MKNEIIPRRTLLKLGLLSAGAAAAEATALRAWGAETPVRQVLLVTLCHLDVGFSGTQASVLEEYFRLYYPEAIRRAAESRHRGQNLYRWTTGAWLLYKYLEQASAAQRKAVEQAVAAGDITWHAMAFNWQTEMLDRSMIDGCMAFSSTLDQRFGTRTTGGKMTDVPGHSRGLIAPLTAAGVRLLDVGVNAASTPPDVPDLFLWKNPAGESLAILYHRHDYGGIVRIPGTDVAVDVEVRTDNSGPHTIQEVDAIYAKLRGLFPEAQVAASSMSEVAAVVDRVRDHLPVITAEIGDTWIYGVASDPEKVAAYREAARLRKAWIAQTRFRSGDSTDRALLQSLALAAEHTWGTDTKRYVDYDHYRPAELAEVLNQPGYKVMEASWQEKRNDISTGIATLSAAMQSEVAERQARLKASKAPSAGMQHHDLSQTIETDHYLLRLDPTTGAIIRLVSRRTGREWASPSHPLALFTYQTLSAVDYATYQARYLQIHADWAPKDFGKPGIAKCNARAQEWHPSVDTCWRSQSADETRILVEMHIEDQEAEASGNVAWPRFISLELRLPASEPRIELRLTTLRKAANRLPEAMWLTFAPIAPDSQGWMVEKVNQWVNVYDVVRGGGRTMHAISETLRYQDAEGRLDVHALDTPLVALGARSPLNFSLELPDLSLGTHFGLFNNAWGTNYLQWAAGDWVYRFSLEI